MLFIGPAIDAQRARLAGPEASPQSPMHACQLPGARSCSIVAVTHFHPQPQAPAPLSTSSATGWTACVGIGGRLVGLTGRHRRNMHRVGRRSFPQPSIDQQPPLSLIFRNPTPAGLVTQFGISSAYFKPHHRRCHGRDHSGSPTAWDSLPDLPRPHDDRTIRGDIGRPMG